MLGGPYGAERLSDRPDGPTSLGCGPTGSAVRRIEVAVNPERPSAG